MMKCVEIQENTLRLTERPVPEPASGEVLIRVHAAGVNRPDILQRMGHYPPPSGITDIPGLEVAGIRQDTGEAVCALLAGGGYAEYAVAPVGQCLPVPAGLSMAEAAALPETVFTVWHNVFERGALKAGEKFLVHGGTSGIGTTAIQMAKAFGAIVIATAGSDEKCAACAALGADLAINYKTQDFVQEIEKTFGKDSIDVVLDMVGGSYIQRDIALMAGDGRHVSIAFLQGRRAEIDVQAIMGKRLTLTGSTLRARPVAEKTAMADSIRAHVWPLITQGKIRPVIHDVLPLGQAGQAHALLENSLSIGKVVLNIGT